MNTLPIFSISLSQPADKLQAKGPEAKLTPRNTKGKARDTRRRSPSLPSLHRLASTTSSKYPHESTSSSSTYATSEVGSNPASPTFPVTAIASPSVSGTRSKSGSEPPDSAHKPQRQTTAPIPDSPVPMRRTASTRQSLKPHPSGSSSNHFQSSSISSTSTLSAALKPSISVKWFTKTKIKQKGGKLNAELNSEQPPETVSAATAPSASSSNLPNDVASGKNTSKRVSVTINDLPVSLSDLGSDTDSLQSSPPTTPPVTRKNKIQALLLENPHGRPPPPDVTKRSVLPNLVLNLPSLKKARRRSHTISITPTRTTPEPICDEKDGWWLDDRYHSDSGGKATPGTPVSDIVFSDRPETPQPRKEGENVEEEGAYNDDTFSVSEEGTTEAGQGYFGTDEKPYSSRSQTSFGSTNETETHKASFRSRASSPDLHEHPRLSEDGDGWILQVPRELAPTPSIFDGHHYRPLPHNYQHEYFEVNDYYPSDYNPDEFVRATSPTFQMLRVENETYKGSYEEANNWIGSWNRASYQDVIAELRELF